MHKEILDKITDEDYDGVIDILVENKGTYSLAWISHQIEIEDNMDRFKALQGIIIAWEKRFGILCDTLNIKRCS